MSMIVPKPKMKEEDDEQWKGNPAFSPSSGFDSNNNEDKLTLLDSKQEKADALDLVDCELGASIHDKDESHDSTRVVEVVPRFLTKEHPGKNNMEQPPHEVNQHDSVGNPSMQSSSNSHRATTPGAVRVNPGFRSADDDSSSSESDLEQIEDDGDHNMNDDLHMEEVIEAVEGELDIEEDERIRQEVLRNMEYAPAEVVKDDEEVTPLWRRRAVLLLLLLLAVATCVIVVVLTTTNSGGGGSSTQSSTTRSSPTIFPTIPPPTAKPSLMPSYAPSSSPTFLAWELLSTIRDDRHADATGFGSDVEILTIHEGMELSLHTDKAIMLVMTSPRNISISTYFCDNMACEAGMFVEQSALFGNESELSVNVMIDLSRDGNTLAFATESYSNGNITAEVGVIDLSPILSTITDHESFNGPIDFLPIPDSQAKTVKLSDDGSLLSTIGERLTICNLHSENVTCIQPFLVNLDGPSRNPDDGVAPGILVNDPDRPYEIPIALAMDDTYVAMGTNIRDDWYDEAERLQSEQGENGLPITLLDGFYEGFFVRAYDANGDQIGQAINYQNEDILSVKSLSLAANGTLLSVGYALHTITGILIRNRFFPCFVDTYRLVNETWILSNPTLLGNTPRRDFFGYSVALSREGDSLFVGAPSAIVVDDRDEEVGRVYAYKWSGSDWEISSSLSNEVADSFFGGVLAATDDGDSLIIGAPNLVNAETYHYQYQSF